MTKECPFGLSYEFFECNPTRCSNLGKPCRLLYDPWTFVETEWTQEHGLIIVLPEFSGDCDHEDSEEIFLVELHDRRVERIRIEMWLEGWWESIELPYTSHPDGGLLVVESFGLDDNSTFASPWLFEDGFQRFLIWWESFEPPVPVDGYQRKFGKSPVSTDRYFPDAFDKPLVAVDEKLLYYYHF